METQRCIKVFDQGGDDMYNAVAAHPLLHREVLSTFHLQI